MIKVPTKTDVEKLLNEKIQKHINFLVKELERQNKEIIMLKEDLMCNGIELSKKK